MNKSYINNNTGISYTLVGDYYLPNLVVPAEEEQPLGRYGRLRLEYLKNHRKVTYLNYLTSGTLNEHLYDVDTKAKEQIEQIVLQMAKADGVDEKLKASDPMRWVGLMNNYKACTEEMVLEWVLA